MHDFLSTGRHLLWFSFMISLKVKFMYRSNHAEHYKKKNHIIVHSQNTTAFQLDVFLIGIYQLLVTNRRRSAFFSGNQVTDCMLGSNGSVDNNISKCRCSILLRKEVRHSDTTTWAASVLTLERLTTPIVVVPHR